MVAECGQPTSAQVPTLPQTLRQTQYEHLSTRRLLVGVLQMLVRGCFWVCCCGED
jgi:hypothetical protein